MTSIISTTEIHEVSCVQHTLIESFRELTTPFYERQKLIDGGHVLEAVSKKPSGIWYAETYRAALKSLGDTPVPVGKGSMKASHLLERLRSAGFFFHAMAPQKFWSNFEKEDSPTLKSRLILVMNKGVLASQAYQSFSGQLSFLDCSQVLEIAMAITIIKLLGSSLFDYIANSMPSVRIGDNRSEYNIVSKFVDKIPFVPFGFISRESPTLCIGQTYYINSIKKYILKHPYGNLGSFNLVYIGNAKFIGFGLNPEGVSLEDIAKTLCDGYNAPVVDTSEILPEGTDRGDPFTYSLKNTQTEEVIRVTKKMAEKYAENLIQAPTGFTQEDFKEILDPLKQAEAARKCHTIALAEFLCDPDLFSNIPSLLIMSSNLKGLYPRS